MNPRRLIPHLLLFLPLGALATYATAWSLTLWSPFTRGTHPSESCGPDGWPSLNTGPDGSQGWWFTDAGRGIVRAVPSGAHGSSEGGFTYWRGEFTPAYCRAGWPLLSLQSTVHAAYSPSQLPLSRWNLPLREIVHRGLNTSDLPPFLHAQQARRLALIPVWPGFAINTGAYAALAWGSIAALAAARRALRLRRGQCPTCAYNLAGLPPKSPCPECGHASPKPLPQSPERPLLPRQ